MKLAIEYLAPQDLRPYERNARKHSAAQVRQIADSITQFGFTAPVLIDGANMILAGHGRVSAALLLGMTSVPCIRVESLTETQKRAYILADNKLALNATWDEDLLARELQTLLESSPIRVSEPLSEPPRLFLLLLGLALIWAPQLRTFALSLATVAAAIVIATAAP